MTIEGTKYIRTNIQFKIVTKHVCYRFHEQL